MISTGYLHKAINDKDIQTLGNENILVMLSTWWDLDTLSRSTSWGFLKQLLKASWSVPTSGNLAFKDISSPATAARRSRGTDVLFLDWPCISTPYGPLVSDPRQPLSYVHASPSRCLCIHSGWASLTRAVYLHSVSYAWPTGKISCRWGTWRKHWLWPSSLSFLLTGHILGDPASWLMLWSINWYQKSLCNDTRQLPVWIPIQWSMVYAKQNVEH